MKHLVRAIAVCLALAPMATQAGVLQFWLHEPFQPGTPSSELLFVGTIRNDTGSRVYLNGESLNLFQPQSWSWQHVLAESRLLIDGPEFLEGGTEWTGTAIRVEIGAGAEIGRQHFGNLGILGGASAGAQDPLADANFGLEVVPVPEPGTIGFLGLTVLSVIRRRRSTKESDDYRKRRD